MGRKTTQVAQALKGEAVRRWGGESMLPRITVVTPSLNQGRFLQECVRSVLGQAYPNLEYIVMDGGSTDESLEILRRHEGHLAYWQTGPDGGQYAAVAAGFRRATGEILCWLNADDKLHPRALFTVAYVFARWPDIHWITGRPTVLDADGNLGRIGSASARSRREFLGRRAETMRFVQQESTFWRRGLWERAGGEFRRDLEYAADFELWMRFFRLAPLWTVDALLGAFRTHGGQRSVRHRKEYLAEVERVARQERESWPWGSVAADRAAPRVLRLDPGEVRAWLVRNGVGEARLCGELGADRDRAVDFLLHAYDDLRRQNEALRARLRVLGLLSEAVRRLSAALGRRWSGGKA